MAKRPETKSPEIIRVTLRLSDYEKFIINHRAKAFDLTATEYVRRCVFNVPIQTTIERYNLLTLTEIRNQLYRLCGLFKNSYRINPSYASITAAALGAAIHSGSHIEKILCHLSQSSVSETSVFPSMSMIKREHQAPLQAPVDISLPKFSDSRLKNIMMIRVSSDQYEALLRRAGKKDFNVSEYIRSQIRHRLYTVVREARQIFGLEQVNEALLDLGRSFIKEYPRIGEYDPVIAERLTALVKEARGIEAKIAGIAQDFFQLNKVSPPPKGSDPNNL